MFRVFANLAVVLAAITSSSAVPTLEGRQATAAVSCKPFKGQGWTKASRAHINFYAQCDDSSYNRPTLPADVQIATNKYLYLSNRNISDAGYVFHIETCNVNTTNVQLSSSVIEIEGPYDEQPTGYHDYVRVVNPVTGHCLVPNHYKGATSAYTFAVCDPEPQDDRQFYSAWQIVYSPSCYAGCNNGSIGDIDLQSDAAFDPDGYNGGDRRWMLGSDNHTTLSFATGDEDCTGLAARLYQA